MSAALSDRIKAGLAKPVREEVRAFAENLARGNNALAVLFYGSNLRTGVLEGVLDFYVLMPGPQTDRIWPRVSYKEWQYQGVEMRAKIARMSLEKFAEAARGASRDTTVWARFVQPSALLWAVDDGATEQVQHAVASAAKTAARLAVALGPTSATADDYWRALFRATYKAEFRVEKSGRENAILAVNQEHFGGLLPAALTAQRIGFDRAGDLLSPKMLEPQRKRIIHWWNRRRFLGKPLNLLRLIRASSTFDGAARYAAWKVERHTGVKIELTPWRERHPVLAAPAVLWQVWRARRAKG